MQSLLLGVRLADLCRGPSVSYYAVNMKQCNVEGLCSRQCMQALSAGLSFVLKMSIRLVLLPKRAWHVHMPFCSLIAHNAMTGQT